MVFLEEGARPGMPVPKLLAPQLLSLGRAGHSGTDYKCGELAPANAVHRSVESPKLAQMIVTRGAWRLCRSKIVGYR
jgi:hypothetical protein